MKSNFGSHLYSVTYLRGIAAVLVCMFHFTNKPDFLSDHSILKNLFSIGHYGVEIFFIISGFIIPYSMRAGGYRIRYFGLFFWKRILRIEPPFLVCVLLCVLLDFLTTLRGGYVGKEFSVSFIQLISHVGYFTPFIKETWINPVFWTLGIEFQYYLMMALIFPALEKRNMAVAALVGFNLLSFISDYRVVFHYSLYFSLGMLIYLYKYKIMVLREYLIVAVAHLVCIYLRYSISEVLLGTFSLVMINMSLRPVPWLVMLGNISFSMYLLHVPLGMRVLNMVATHSSEELIRILAIFVALGVTIISSVLYYRWVERYFKRKAGSLRYKVKAKPVEASV